ncbi:hypothetical protein B0A52_06375 [Exophiala mesophila]|uniref:Phenazine biosynthesis protein n=1 Tax=Exophiala mesophila TaxID=212818 RepID=A0A438N1Y2_EXOME|nr:hypothetical protein B0A52_06375 [Exophiala mesophila]
MGRTLQYNTSDVFTGQPFKGNQLAIVHVQQDVVLTQSEKQSIAIEFNFSETVFLHQPTPQDPDATYKADIFTPEAEIPFAGHPTIGTACYIFETLETTRNNVTINLKAGQVKALYDRHLATAAAEIPHDFRLHAAQVPWKRVVDAQPGLKSVEFEHSTIPVASIVKGVTFGLLDLSAQPELLRNVQVTKDDIPLHSDLDDGWKEGLIADLFYIYKPDQGDGVIRIQQRLIGLGLEDPATGSASAALTAYLALQKGDPSTPYKFELEQGVEMGRRSIIGSEVHLSEDGKAIKTIILSGQSKPVMRGELLY